MLEVEIEQIQESVSEHGYEYKKFLGKGSYSSVSLCHSKKYNQEFAIKRTMKESISFQEYNTLCSLNHPSIISLYDSFEDDDSAYLVMDYCSNGTIRQKKNISYNQFINYAKQILEGLAYCHSKNIAHRDIKPDNIFLDQYDHIKIGDFGLAKQFDNNKKSAEKCGSFNFIAPEMFQYHEICPFKADIWALGVTFYYILTGDYPFKGTSREKIKQSIIFGDISYKKYKIDQRIQFLINKMTVKNPNSRPTAEKLLKLPIFSPELSKKTLLMTIAARRNTCPSKVFNRSSWNFDQIQDDTSDNKKISLLDAHCYQSIIAYPNTQRIGSHYPLGKPA